MDLKSVRIWGEPGSGDSQFEAPAGSCFYNNEIYIADSGNDRIQVFDTQGTFKRKWGAYGVGDADFYIAKCVFVYNNEAYVVTRNYRITVFDTVGNYKRKWGSPGTGWGQFESLHGLFVYKDRVYTISNHKVSVFDLNGVHKARWGNGGCSSDNAMGSPTGLFVYNDEVYVHSINCDRVTVFDLNGNFKRKFGSSGSGDGEFDACWGLAIHEDEIYVPDYALNRIQVFDLNGVYKRKWGSAGTASGQFTQLYKMFISPIGEIYTTDITASLERIQVFAYLFTYPVVPVPDFPIKETQYYDVLTTGIPGKELTRSRHTTVVRNWILNYTSINDGDCKYLWGFFNDRKGKHERFHFIHPETSDTYIVRFADDALRRTETGDNLYNVTVNLVEVIG